MVVVWIEARVVTEHLSCINRNSSLSVMSVLERFSGSFLGRLCVCQDMVNIVEIYFLPLTYEACKLPASSQVFVIALPESGRCTEYVFVVARMQVVSGNCNCVLQLRLP